MFGASPVAGYFIDWFRVRACFGRPGGKATTATARVGGKTTTATARAGGKAPTKAACRGCAKRVAAMDFSRDFQVPAEHAEPPHQVVQGHARAPGEGELDVFTGFTEGLALDPSLDD